MFQTFDHFFRIRKSSEHIEFNPEAWKISDAAKRAIATSRVIELSQPKVRE